MAHIFRIYISRFGLWVCVLGFKIPGEPVGGIIDAEEEQLMFN